MAPSEQHSCTVSNSCTKWITASANGNHFLSTENNRAQRSGKAAVVGTALPDPLCCTFLVNPPSSGCPWAERTSTTCLSSFQHLTENLLHSSPKIQPVHSAGTSAMPFYPFCSNKPGSLFAQRRRFPQWHKGNFHILLPVKQQLCC